MFDRRFKATTIEISIVTTLILFSLFGCIWCSGLYKNESTRESLQFKAGATSTGSIVQPYYHSTEIPFVNCNNRSIEVLQIQAMANAFNLCHYSKSWMRKVPFLIIQSFL